MSNFFSYFLLTTTLTISLEKGSALQRLRVYYQWDILDYTYSTLEERVDAIYAKKFVPENNLPFGIEVWKDKIFITVPRWREGVPATLNYVTINDFMQERYKSPALTPYPSWKANEAGNCREGLTTVHRIRKDRCNRLWVLDTGTFGLGNNTRHLCPYTLNVIDLNTDEIVHIGKNCEDVFAYMSDELGYGLIAYSWEKDTSWRFSHPFFSPDPIGGDFTIDGFNFQWNTEGISSMVLSLPQKDGYRFLFFSPLASYREFAVSTKILRNETNVNNSYHDFIALNDRGKNSHITAKVMDDRGVEFFTLVDINAVGCWYSRLTYSPNFLEVVHRDDKNMIYPSDIAIDNNRNLWVISDQLTNYLYKSLEFTHVNFRIFTAAIDDLVRESLCGIY
ncbi:hypothetical protein ILUMI_09915 [Ignelater luminosus]|uniref:Protein yellow n=1 Tax=Ignelater luminosus TaxID=2038154 RepID=A0A8K0D864_IGNLU|nr:hypothetical protein ILUMI_09915 [Ignelater luminosus]